MGRATTRARKREFKAISGAEFKVLDEAQGIGEFYVSVYGVEDSMKEIVDFGAYGKSLGTKLPKGVWSHDWETPIAKTIEAEEVPAGDPRLSTKIKEYGGLRIKAQFNMETQRGSEAFSDVKGGYIDEFSIGYEVPDDYVKEGVRHLKTIRLYEWSPVLVGANPLTETIAAKALSAPLPKSDKASRQQCEDDGGEWDSATDTCDMSEAEKTLCATVVGKATADTGEEVPLVCGQPKKSHPIEGCSGFTKTNDPVATVSVSRNTASTDELKSKIVEKVLDQIAKDEKYRKQARALLVAKMAEKDLAVDVEQARPWNDVMLILQCFDMALESIVWGASDVDTMKALVIALADELQELLGSTEPEDEMSAGSGLPATTDPGAVDPIIYSDSYKALLKEGRILSDGNYKHVLAAREHLGDVITAHETAMAARETVSQGTEEATEVATSKAGVASAGTGAVDTEADRKMLERIESLETRLIGTLSEIGSNLKRLGIVLPKKTN